MPATRKARVMVSGRSNGGDRDKGSRKRGGSTPTDHAVEHLNAGMH